MELFLETYSNGERVHVECSDIKEVMIKDVIAQKEGRESLRQATEITVRKDLTKNFSRHAQFEGRKYVIEMPLKDFTALHVFYSSQNQVPDFSPSNLESMKILASSLKAGQERPSFT